MRKQLILAALLFNFYASAMETKKKWKEAALEEHAKSIYASMGEAKKSKEKEIKLLLAPLKKAHKSNNEEAKKTHAASIARKAIGFWWDDNELCKLLKELKPADLRDDVMQACRERKCSLLKLKIGLAAPTVGLLSSCLWFLSPANSTHMENVARPKNPCLIWTGENFESCE